MRGLQLNGFLFDSGFNNRCCFRESAHITKISQNCTLGE